MKTININVPRGWHELDEKQLRYLFGLLADDYSSAEIRTLCLLRWSGLKVLQKTLCVCYEHLRFVYVLLLLL